MKVIITRARPGALKTEKLLHLRGYHSVLAPLFEIHPLSPSFELKEPLQALLFTSPNAVQESLKLSLPREKPVYTVGEATASQARAAGFTKVESADGDSRDLLSVLEDRLDPDKGQLLHICGRHLAGDLVGSLQKKGFKAERCTVYEASPVRTLPHAMAEVLKDPAFKVVLFHSPRGAEVFSMLMEQQGLISTYETLGAVVISQAVKKCLKPRFACLYIAEHPSDMSLIDALERIRP